MGNEAGENVAPIHDALGAIAGCDLMPFISFNANPNPRPTKGFHALNWILLPATTS